MSFRIKLYTVAAFIGFLFLVSSGTAEAREVWIKGIVTKAVWTDQYQHIEVDNVMYTFMPKVLEIRLLRRSGYASLNSKRDALRSIRDGQTVWLNVQGRRIYEILVEK